MPKIQLNIIREILNIIPRANADALFAFVAAEKISSLDIIRQQNFDILITEALTHGVRFLYVGYAEIAGNERKRCSQDKPVMWEIARNVGFPPSCGNSDQYQCAGINIAFPDDAYGGWDLVTGIKMTDEEVEHANFFRVVDRNGRNGRVVRL